MIKKLEYLLIYYIPMRFFSMLYNKLELIQIKHQKNLERLISYNIEIDDLRCVTG